MKVAVLGAGNGGCASATDLTLRGHDVQLYDLFSSYLDPIKENQDQLRYSGVWGDGECKLSLVSGDIQEVLQGVDLIMMNVPGPGHVAYAEKMAPHLNENCIILMNPGHSGGALRLAHVLRENGAPASIRIAETNTLSYISRLTKPGEVYVSSSDKGVFVGVFPAKYTDETVELIHELYPNMIKAKNVLYTTMSNINAMFHPPGMICNAGWIEHTNGNFRFYYDGITPAIGNVIDAMDLERLEVAKKFGLEMYTFVMALYKAGSTSKQAVEANSAYQACQDSEGNKFIMAPPLDHRYMHEDIGSGLVAMAFLADIVGVPTPVMDAQIVLGGCLMQKNYWEEGVNLKKMGIENMVADELMRYVQDGFESI